MQKLKLIHRDKETDLWNRLFADAKRGVNDVNSGCVERCVNDDGEIGYRVTLIIGWGYRAEEVWIKEIEEEK